MANSLGIDLTGKTVIMPDGSRFVCEGGFGCHDFTMGRAIFGRFEGTGEMARVSGCDVVKLADDPAPVAAEGEEGQ